MFKLPLVTKRTKICPTFLGIEWSRNNYHIHFISVDFVGPNTEGK